MRFEVLGHDGLREICRNYGGPTLGHSHGIALWYLQLTPMQLMNRESLNVFLFRNLGTMSDDEMRQLGVPALQDDGLIFLWVTGRAMELGRECLKLWGYEV